MSFFLSHFLTCKTLNKSFSTSLEHFPIQPTRYRLARPFETVVVCIRESFFGAACKQIKEYTLIQFARPIGSTSTWQLSSIKGLRLLCTTTTSMSRRTSMPLYTQSNMNRIPSLLHQTLGANSWIAFACNSIIVQAHRQQQILYKLVWISDKQLDWLLLSSL